jgi:hypothetical protein
MRGKYSGAGIHQPSDQVEIRGAGPRIQPKGDINVAVFPGTPSDTRAKEKHQPDILMLPETPRHFRRIQG